MTRKLTWKRVDAPSDDHFVVAVGQMTDTDVDPVMAARWPPTVS